MRIFITILFIITGLYSFSQSYYRGNELNFSCFQTIGGNYRIGYERFTNENSSAVIYLSYISVEKDYIETTGYSGELQYRFYTPVFKEDYLRLYFGPYIMYKYIDEKYLMYSQKMSKFTTKSANTCNVSGTGMVTGIKINPVGQFYVDLGFGIGYRFAKTTTGYSDMHPENGLFTMDYCGVSPKANLSIGILF